MQRIRFRISFENIRAPTTGGDPAFLYKYDLGTEELPLFSKRSKASALIAFLAVAG